MLDGESRARTGSRQSRPAFFGSDILKPLVPSDLVQYRRDLAGRGANAVVRAVIAQVRAFLDHADAAEFVQRTWPDDRQAFGMVAKGASVPATTTAAGWASDVTTTGIGGLLTTLGPASAGSELLRRSLVLSFGRYANIYVPGVVAAAGNVGFVKQGDPIAVRQFDTSSGILLSPAKFATIVVLTGELIQGSNAEVLVRQVLTESVGLALDSALFDSAAGTDARPAGLLHNISALPATPGGSIDAMREDLGALAAAVAPIGGLNLAYVASPDAAVKIMLAAGPDFRFPLLASGVLASDMVICIALNALAAAVDPTPQITTSSSAILHMDTAPQPISVPGPTMAAPTRSTFQTDSIGVRLVMSVAWGLRASSAIAWMQNVTW